MSGLENSDAISTVEINAIAPSATALQTYDNEERLRDVASGINSTASALKQLQYIVTATRLTMPMRVSKRFSKTRAVSILAP
jgi:hypothetical protein